jgi:hypothetical protein
VRRRRGLERTTIGYGLKESGGGGLVTLTTLEVS